ncbi:hypothetical protein, partial [Leyella lascolaii]|uniref:hypothetical protein n=1 Tax=Leyella lascolaii TaxID=1776379 RepID=UPI002942E01F
WKESLFSISRVQQILCKDLANEWKESLFSISRVQQILCKDTANRVYEEIKAVLFFLFPMLHALRACLSGGVIRRE